MCIFDWLSYGPFTYYWSCPHSLTDFERISHRRHSEWGQLQEVKDPNLISRLVCAGALQQRWSMWSLEDQKETVNKFIQRAMFIIKINECHCWHSLHKSNRATPNEESDAPTMKYPIINQISLYQYFSKTHHHLVKPIWWRQVAS